jgi:hypothetical protein
MSLSSDGTALIGRTLFPVFRHPFRTILTDDPLNPLTHSVEETTVEEEEDAGELKMKNRCDKNFELMIPKLNGFENR